MSVVKFTSKRREQMRAELHARRAIVDAAVAFQNAMENSRKQNTNAAEIVVEKTMEELRLATVRYQRLLKKRPT